MHCRSTFSNFSERIDSTVFKEEFHIYQDDFSRVEMKVGMQERGGVYNINI